jgi:hypothetical protein
MRFVKTKIRRKQEGDREMKQEPRKVRHDLTAEEKERLEKYGSIDFKSAGATRKR